MSLGTGDGFQENDLILSGDLTNNPGEVHQLFRHWNGEAYQGRRRILILRRVREVGRQAWRPRGGSEARATLPNEPAPVKADVVGTGQNDASQRISVAVTNLSHIPLSGFMVVYRNSVTGGVWRDVFVDACLDHHAAWQPGQQWTREFGTLLTIRKMEAYVGAALFSDGSTWGDAKRLAKLKQHRGSCQWPGA